MSEYEYPSPSIDFCEEDKVWKLDDRGRYKEAVDAANEHDNQVNQYWLDKVDY